MDESLDPPHAKLPDGDERPAPATALERFIRSMEINYEKWHDGVGYDLDILRQAAPADRGAIERMLMARDVEDWRDVEALAMIDSSRARFLLRKALEHPDAQVRLAVVRYAPELISEDARTSSLVKALESAELYGGLSEAIDDAASFHPQPVVDALLRGALVRDGEAAVNFAAMLMYIHGKTDDPFDWEHRPFFLTFNTDVRADRERAFRELCERIGVDPEPYLTFSRVQD